MPHLESTIKTQRITCLKTFIDKLSQSMEINPLAPSQKITGINFFFIAIMMLLTYLNPFQSFIMSVLKLWLHSPRNNQLRSDTCTLE